MRIILSNTPLSFYLGRLSYCLSQTQVPQEIDGHPQEAEKNCLVYQQGASERESPLPVMGPSEAVSRDGPAAGLRLLKIDAAATP